MMRDMGATIIRADRVLRLRADAHVEPDRHQDCLHYWAPGVSECCLSGDGC